MDLRSALSALLRPVALPPVPIRPMNLPFGYSDSTLLALTKFDPSLMSVVPLASESSAIYTPKKSRIDDSPCSPLSSNSSTVSSTQFSSPQPSPIRKTAKPIPDEKKDDAYFERRRKNNDAAKRSRDARRAKEEAIAARAAALEQDNIQLRGQVALLKSETARLQLLLFSSRQNTNLSLSPSIQSSRSEKTDQIEV